MSTELGGLRNAGEKPEVVLSEKFEIIYLAGTFSRNGSHLHICMADENEKC